MPLFRYIRRELDESLETTIIVKDEQELRAAILKNWEIWLDHPKAQESNFNGFEIKIGMPRDTLAECFDKRCGWYQLYVSADVLEKGKFCMEGFLSEPLPDDATKKQRLYCPFADCVVQRLEHYHIDEHTITFRRPTVSGEGHICFTKDVHG